MKNDGTVLAWGNNLAGQTDIPAGLNNVVALAPGCEGYHALVIQRRTIGPVALLGGANEFNSLNMFDGSVQVNSSVLATGWITAAHFAGEGGWLTNLNAGQLCFGTVPDARLGPNVARLNRNQTFSGANTFLSSANQFAGNGSGLASLDAGTISAGTLADPRLSDNVALLNRNQNSFAGTVTANGTSNNFSDRNAKQDIAR